MTIQDTHVNEFLGGLSNWKRQSRAYLPCRILGGRRTFPALRDVDDDHVPGNGVLEHL